MEEPRHTSTPAPADNSKRGPPESNELPDQKRVKINSILDDSDISAVCIDMATMAAHAFTVEMRQCDVDSIAASLQASLDGRISAMQASFDSKVMYMQETFASKVSEMQNNITSVVQGALSDINQHFSVLVEENSKLKERVTFLESAVNLSAIREQHSQRTCLQVPGTQEKASEPADHIIMEIPSEIDADISLAEIECTHLMHDEAQIVESVEDALSELRKLEIATHARYVTWTVTKNFGKTTIHKSSIKHVMWHGDIPFVVLGKRTMTCHHGPDKHKKQKEMEKLKADSEHAEQTDKTKKRKMIVGTKKKHCPARVLIREILTFAHLANEDTDKKVVANLIRRRLEQGRRCFMTMFPADDKHENHPVGKIAGLSLRMDELLRNKIAELVHEGVNSAKDMKNHLHTYAIESLNHPFDPLNRRFFPSHKTIKDYMDRVRKIMKSSADQANLENLLYVEG